MADNLIQMLAGYSGVVEDAAKSGMSAEEFKARLTEDAKAFYLKLQAQGMSQKDLQTVMDKLMSTYTTQFVQVTQADIQRELDNLSTPRWPFILGGVAVLGILVFVLTRK